MQPVPEPTRILHENRPAAPLFDTALPGAQAAKSPRPNADTGVAPRFFLRDLAGASPDTPRSTSYRG